MRKLIDKIILTLLVITCIPVFGQNTNIAVHNFFIGGIVQGVYSHLVWENVSDVDITMVAIERSYDGIAFTEISKANTSDLPDIHLLDYPSEMNYNNSVLFSTETGNSRFIFNDYFDPLSDQNNLYYQIKMIADNGAIYSSDILHVTSQSMYQNVTPEDDPPDNNVPLLQNGSKPGCPSIGSPPAGYVNTGQTQIQYGNCCSWTETKYQASTVQIPCGGGSYAWCCQGFPEAGSCPSLYVSDPCCVHTCGQYGSCSCHPWVCCLVSFTEQWVVTQSADYTAITLVPSITHETCDGMLDGTISIAVVNGTAPYTATWSPAQAGNTTITNLAGGTYSVTVTDANNCSATGTYVVNSAPGTPVSIPPYSDQCINSPNYTLFGGTPSGGSYIGPGVTGTSFNPPTAGVGIHNIIYLYIDSIGCNCRDTSTITVHDLPVVNLPQFNTVCVYDPSFVLTGGNPAGGSYSGPGVTGNLFNPATAGVGVHNIVYTYTDGNSCTNTATNTIEVALPVVQLASLPPVCINDPAFALSGGTPAGGTFSGTGVSGGNFDPGLAGVGSHVITYTYTDPSNGCFNAATKNQVVNPLPTITHTPLPLVCVITPPFLLTGATPSGGNYAGPGVTNNIFDPAAAGIGSHNLDYTYTNPVTNCTRTISVNIVVAANINVNIVPNDVNICYGSNVSLFATGAQYYYWSPASGLSDTIGDTVMANPLTSTVYSVYGTNDWGCTGAATANVNVYPPVNVVFNYDPPYGCKPLEVKFEYEPTMLVTEDGWSWDFDDMYSTNTYSSLEDPVHIFTEHGIFNVELTVTSIYGCKHSASMPVEVYQRPVANFMWHPEEPNMENPLVSFLDASLYENSWDWNFGDPNSGYDNFSDQENPLHVYSDSGQHIIQLIAASHPSCTDTIRKSLYIYPRIIVFIPNAFSPDNNLLNDTWKPITSGISEDGYDLEIFDRWGKRLFQTNNTYEGWNGKVGSNTVPIGIYVWILRYKALNGKNYIEKGHLTVVR